MDKVYFEVVNNKRIFCIFSEPKDLKKEIIIMNHGFRGDSLGPARTFRDFAKLLLEAGYAVFRFDQPNSGNSEGDYLNSSFNEWVETTSYFAREFLSKGYKVSLLGQSMGATTSGVVASREEFRNKISSILLWVPGVTDPEHKIKANKIYEEAGQKYRGQFWLEAAKEDFPNCLNNYEGKIHLVYGDRDRYVRDELREKVIKIIKQEKQEYLILKGQDHSPWNYDIAQDVYTKQLSFLKK
jgi:uncharacterized protein